MDSTIIGARTLEQLDQNLGALSVTLDAADVAALEAVSTPTLGFPIPFLQMADTIMHAGATVDGEPSETWPMAPVSDRGAILIGQGGDGHHDDQRIGTWDGPRVDERVSGLRRLVPGARGGGAASGPDGRVGPGPRTPEVDAGMTAETILDRALARAALQDESGLELEYEYLVASTVDSLNGDGEVTETEAARYHRYPLEGLLYEELTEKDGQPLDDDARREERERKEEFVREARAHAARGERYEPDEMNVRFDRGAHVAL